jgi:hypothetical protein
MTACMWMRRLAAALFGLLLAPTLASPLASAAADAGSGADRLEASDKPIRIKDKKVITQATRWGAWEGFSTSTTANNVRTGDGLTRIRV